MTKDQENNALKTLQEIELILDPAPSPGGDVVWLLNNLLTNLKQSVEHYRITGDGCRLDASRMGDRTLKAEGLLRSVKAWRDSDGNEAFPHELRQEIDATLKADSEESNAEK